jgi:hypothetical protein
MLTIGLNKPELSNMAHIEGVLIAVFLERAEAIRGHADASYGLLDELEGMLLDRIRAELDGVEQDAAQIGRAAAILTAADNARRDVEKIQKASA